MRVLLALWFASLALSAQAQPNISAQAQPNIVVILTDDQDVTSAYGWSQSLNRTFMPTLAALAERGITFTNAFNNNPLCSPSRATWQSGQEAHNHGIERNEYETGDADGIWKTSEGNSLPVWLQSAGYRTGYLGKHLNGSFDTPVNGYVAPDKTRVPVGWDNWQAMAQRGYFNWELNDNGRLVSYGSNAGAYQTDVLAEKAVLFIEDEDEERPFFLMVAPFSPHTDGRNTVTPAPRHASTFSNEPLPQGPAFNEADVTDKPGFIKNSSALTANDEQAWFDYVRSLFHRSLTVNDVRSLFRKKLNALQSVDDLIGSVINAVDEAGKLNDTCFVFASDNGESFGDHRFMGKGVAYEASLRIPLVIACPGMKKEAREQLVTNVDLVPTILQWAGATPGRTQDGKSLVNLLSDERTPWRSAFFIEGPGGRWTGVRSVTHKYVKQTKSGFEELYDLVHDPDELQNKAGDPTYAGTLNQMRDLLNRLSSCTGAGCWTE